MNLNFASYLGRNIRHHPRKEQPWYVALRKKTWIEYDKAASKLASALNDSGLKTYSKAGLYLHNSKRVSRSAVLQFFKIGGTPINVNYRYKADELMYLLDNSDCEALFYQACYGDQINLIKDSLPKN